MPLFPAPDESAHDSDVDQNNPMAVQYAGEHRNTLLCENVRKKPPAPASYI